MPMPTTRYARFLFFKKRALRRREKARRYRAKPGLFGKRRHAWGFVIDVEKQAAGDVQPKPKLRAFNWDEVEFWGGSRAHYRVPPVVTMEHAPPQGLTFPPTNRPRLGRVLFQQRRVGSYPPLWMMNRQYRFPATEPPTSGQWYPFKFYPSGQRSPHGTIA